MNNIQITGRLTADPTYRELPGTDGKHVVELRLAVRGMGRGGRDQAGFINVNDYTMTEKAAATIGQGWLVAVDGRLEHDQWEDNDGTKRQTYRLNGQVEFLAAPADTTEAS
jgi:single-stranded DNA-binding protein